jgi:hypothetical protein
MLSKPPCYGSLRNSHGEKRNNEQACKPEEGVGKSLAGFMTAIYFENESYESDIEDISRTFLIFVIF